MEHRHINVMARPTPMSLEDVADTAAAGQHVRDYLEARGIRTTAMLALLARTEDQLETTLALPLFNGWKTTDGRTLRVPPEEQPIAQAILVHMWSLCRRKWLSTCSRARHLHQRGHLRAH